MPVPNAIPRLDDDIQKLVDDFDELAVFHLANELNQVIGAAIAAGDEARASAARCEAFVAVAFFDTDAFGRFRDDITANIFETDLEYLRARAASTPQLRAQARYLQAIAELTRRHDDKQAATKALLTAISKALEDVPMDAPERGLRYNLLVDLFPLAQQMALRCGMRQHYVEAVIDFINEGSKEYVHAKTRVFNALVDVALTRDQAAALRDSILRLLEEAAAGEPGEIILTATNARRLLAKLEEPAQACLEAEARALETNLTYNSHPFRVQQVGSRLLRIYRLLGDDAEAAATIQRMDEASKKIEYTTISVPVEDFETSALEYQAHARNLIEKFGVVGVISWLAQTEVFPSREQTEQLIEKQRDEGIGLFRELATTIISDGERLLAQDPATSEFDETYNFSWGLVLAIMEIYLAEALQTGHLTVPFLFGLFAGSWVGEPDSGEGRDFGVVHLLIPGLRLYLRALEGDRSGIIPALDSLVLHVETVVRKLARLNGIPHVRTTDREGRPIQEFMGLELLDNPQLKTIIGDDLHTFIVHTLKRAPEGLRDQVGHGILKADQYSLRDLNAIFLILLRLAVIRIPRAEGD